MTQSRFEDFNEIIKLGKIMETNHSRIGANLIQEYMQDTKDKGPSIISYMIVNDKFNWFNCNK